ncbi:cobalt-precorrin-6A synthase [Hafnia alvei FB1]|jgi:cobalt-precorrin-5B (C1)-methyltransferase|uniref:Cobalt-precorrin-5B C(1)-methyltransferase n=1 Tax=Hafnia alvei FB1 TaxID=1453496 RepID=A0A097QZM8_HAFAL|nr:cobalt-precorrin-5B (C(1))-methyltransferase CbiD [Hafnia alvei]AIU71922.1 cobalt-precorrin-6A synthase [Hafnia alvei FB1]MDU3155248.1 cobalt-precorrin-5B (C(1))-methyltransferase CbiD [Hafnia alvei]QBJ32269.1 cobalt-precorrin-5B (C(1))-methyltransferase [Hafnia alvei]TBL46023.1 cobalt-precorrin-5B (C(1))-methyltransferase [Hafnia alvei]TBL60682.1 cobalt-precorrin-5B (C(1))-methyltransferase [Hafnia alvei]
MSDTGLDTLWHNGKSYRKGYTTGSCATAAAKVAALMVLRQQVINQVSIVTPSGVTLRLNVEQPLICGQQASAAIRKDGGDDVDATHGMLIFAQVALNDSGSIGIVGGEGVGTVTRKGIGLPVGSSAINRTPLHTIEEAVREVIGPERGAEIVIFAPEGEERAQKTYNGRLGILGGISIIGTTGIVTPMSEESWKRSLALELEMKRAQGMTSVILVPGNHGERFVQEQMQLNGDRVVTMSNFVGYMLQETQRLGFRRVVLVGHLGKLIKVAAGIFHTHSHIADGRMETLVTRLALMGAPRELLQAVFECSTTEAAMELIEQHGLQAVYNDIAQAICARINQMLRFAVQPLQCDAVLFSFDNIVLGSNRPVNDIVADLRTEISQEILCEKESS